jgi:hypothetical protein
MTLPSCPTPRGVLDSTVERRDINIFQSTNLPERARMHAICDTFIASRPSAF